MGSAAAAAGLIGYLLILLLPVDSWVSLPLEDRFPRPAEPSNIDGIIVLGGAIATEITRDRGIPSLNADAERMTEAVALALRHPEARLVFTGASGSVIPGGAIETDGARQLFGAALGLDPARIVFEDRSRNTRENACGFVAPGPPCQGELLAAHHVGQSRAARHRRIPAHWLERDRMAGSLQVRSYVARMG